MTKSPSQRAGTYDRRRMGKKNPLKSVRDAGMVVCTGYSRVNESKLERGGYKWDRVASYLWLFGHDVRRGSRRGEEWFLCTGCCVVFFEGFNQSSSFDLLRNPPPLTTRGRNDAPDDLGFMPFIDESTSGSLRRSWLVNGTLDLEVQVGINSMITRHGVARKEGREGGGSNVRKVSDIPVLAFKQVINRSYITYPPTKETNKQTLDAHTVEIAE
ncbi:hypothetical protein BDY19DRAFT_906572 [Irpex rosettiformis]|uniref:Uncharacterized protein n=1 Tax=Irpex rosettiformis TaxID=378272 RepID=A0ACB8U2T8_9APHY|nr:hypothetical protein BDY19DRAFT_906572 [Irpex rosettiformis]